jgi:hypothetical protein
MVQHCNRNHGHRRSADTHQAPVTVVTPPGAFQLARRGGLRATADLSKRTIVAGHGPACLASRIPAIADGPGRGRPGQRLRP